MEGFRPTRNKRKGKEDEAVELKRTSNGENEAEADEQTRKVCTLNREVLINLFEKAKPR